MENSMEVLQNIKNRTALWPSNCTTRYLSKGYKNTELTGNIHPNVYSSTINNNQIMERAQMSIYWWMDKEDVYTHTHTHTHSQKRTMKYYSAIKKNKILPFAKTWMELESIILSKVSQRKTNTIWFHSYVEFKKQNKQGHLGCSVSSVTLGFGSDHDLAVCVFEPWVRFCADSAEPAWDSLSLFLCPSPIHSLYLSK